MVQEQNSYTIGFMELKLGVFMGKNRDRKVVNALIGLVMCVILMVGMGSTSLARNLSIDIRINNQRLSINSEPYINSGRVMVPIRVVAEALGATEVIWIQQGYVVARFPDKEIIFMIDSYDYWVNGELKVSDVAPTISNGSSMVSVRLLAEELACDVGWNNDFSTVEIIKPEVAIDPVHLATEQYSYDDILWLARITHVEGLNISYDAKLAIANVVLNRVESPSFPGTVYDVIFETEYATQFPPAHRDSFQSLEPSAESWRAAEDALDGNNNVSSCLYFNNSPFKSKSSDLYIIIEGEYFYY